MDKRQLNLNVQRARLELRIAQLNEAATSGDEQAIERLDAVEKVLYPEQDELTVSQQRGMAIRYRVLRMAPWVRAAAEEYKASKDLGRARIAIERAANSYEKANSPLRELYEYVLKHWKPKMEARSLAVRLYFEQCAKNELYFDEAELFRNLRAAEQIPLQTIGPELWRNRKRGWSRDNKIDNRADENQQEPT